MFALIAPVFALLLAGCAATQPARVSAYDFDSAVVAPQAAARLDVPIAIPQVRAPSWLRGTELVYRLDYLVPAASRLYALSRWVAPPAELLTLHLRERVAAANSGFTVTGLDADPQAYLLEVTLEEFTQAFESPTASRCMIQLRATLGEPGGRVLAQRTFRAERPAPSPDASGAVRGLVAATDASIDEVMSWVASNIKARLWISGNPPSMPPRWAKWATPPARPATPDTSSTTPYSVANSHAGIGIGGNSSTIMRWGKRACRRLTHDCAAAWLATA